MKSIKSIILLNMHKHTRPTTISFLGLLHQLELIYFSYLIYNFSLLYRLFIVINNY